jgi:3-oxoacyl-[acyl-carrier-protein] synthase III
MATPASLGHPSADTGPPGTRISAVGRYRPAGVLDTATVARRAGVDPEWIRSRTGIEERRVAADDETVADMAVAAARQALADGPAGRPDVDTVIVATCTAATTIPSVAAEVAARLGLRHPGAFDLNTACAGFCCALACADSLIRSGASRQVLVIGADKATAWVDPLDRDTAILFGDGAGAVVVSPAAAPGIGPVVWGSLGEQRDVIGIDEKLLIIRQDGQAVYRWATGLGPIARQICERSGVALADLAAFIPHQANLRIIKSLARSLGAANALVATDVTESGNTIAATIPLALAHLAQRGSIPAGAPVLLFGFGAGLAYAGQIIIL